MGNLLGFEFRKFFKQKKWLFVTIVFLLLIIGFFGTEWFMENSGRNKYAEVTERNLQYIQNNLSAPIPEKEKLFLKELFSIQEKKLDALKANAKKDVLRLELEELRLELEGREKGTGQSSVPYTEMEHQLELKTRILEGDLLPRNLKFDGTGFVMNVMEALLPLHFFLLIILLLGDITGYENDNGTIRLLKNTPYSTFKIFLGKLIVSISVGMLFLVSLFLLPYLLAGVFKGFGGFQYPEYVNGEWVTTGKLITEYFFYSILLVIFISIVIQFVHVFIRKGLITLLALFILFAIQFFIRPASIENTPIISWNPIVYLHPGLTILDGFYYYSQALLTLGLFTGILFIITVGILRFNRRTYPGL
ncbi:ABC transporter permease subunit [Sporosarcina highlanderae]|uniref:ABC transporter permease subunit n=1 Tax=Sporosarcina highlanderae TaxID=3035916 RepID=A0ABT8JLU0_9BACL|nr:ABC transporter permease subunit [Sporosarcina highlanderae]MDN4606116.1 ABC transporter permease subunit [Sporosarcina highlanderae]